MSGRRAKDHEGSSDRLCPRRKRTRAAGRLSKRFPTLGRRDRILRTGGKPSMRHRHLHSHVSQQIAADRPRATPRAAANGDTPCRATGQRPARLRQHGNPKLMHRRAVCRGRSRDGGHLTRPDRSNLLKGNSDPMRGSLEWQGLLRGDFGLRLAKISRKSAETCWPKRQPRNAKVSATPSSK